MNKKGWVIILSITFVAILLWVAGSIITSKPSVPISPETQKAIEPIVTTFDKSTVEKIRNISSPNQISQPAVPISIPSSIPSPSPLTIPSSTSSGTLSNPSPIATGSGTQIQFF